jgi:hypothetical protein
MNWSSLMSTPSNPLEHYLSEQVALEEQLCKIIEQQISDVDEIHFPDAKNLLLKTKEVLEQHFIPLNKMLDRLDQAALSAQKNRLILNAVTFNGYDRNQENERVSKILRDDYAALNLITMGNTILHTTALALDCQEVAAVALDHLQHLTPLVAKIGELMPHIVTQELLTHSEEIDPAVGHLAAKNLRLVWRNGS